MPAHPFTYTAKRHISCSWQRLNSLGAMSAVSFVSSNLGLLAPEVPERIGRTAGAVWSDALQHRLGWGAARWHARKTLFSALAGSSDNMSAVRLLWNRLTWKGFLLGLLCSWANSKGSVSVMFLYLLLCDAAENRSEPFLWAS